MDKGELRALLDGAMSAKYDLLANVTHTGQPADGSYKTHVYCPPAGTWYLLDDLHVDATLPQLVAVSEAYLQIYERKE